MVTPLYVASAMVTTLFVLAVVGLVVRSERWHGYSPTTRVTLADRLRSAAGQPVVWMLAFALLLVVFGGGTVLWVSGASVPGAELLDVGLAAAGLSVFAVALFVGVYETRLSRGRSPAHGAAEGSFLVGLLLVLLIAVKLVI
jgi:hypothetical protein